MCTMHKEVPLSDREDMKPLIALDYNAMKGGVDNLDEGHSNIQYGCGHKTARWPLVIFNCIVDVSDYSAYII